MRLDLTWLGRKLLNGPRILFGLSLWGVVKQFDVRIGNSGLLKIFVYGSPAFLISPLDLESDLGAAMVLPINLLFLKNPRLVFFGIDLNFEIVSGRSRAGSRDNLNRLAGCQLGIHTGGGYPDALLPSAHAQPVELRAIEKLCEYRRNLLANDAGTVVDHGYPKAVGLARRWGSVPV